MNRQTTHYTHTSQTVVPLAVRQMRLSSSNDSDFQQNKKFTPASRNARIQSWQQRMQGLFSRQAY